MEDFLVSGRQPFSILSIAEIEYIIESKMKTTMINRKFISSISFALSLMLGLFLADYSNHNYAVEDNYSIKFATGKAEGSFTGLSGRVNFDPNYLVDSKINVSVQVSTIKTGNEKKDDHAKNSKWFDAESFPTMKYESTSIEKSGMGYIVTGNLTVKDVSKEEKISFSYDNEVDDKYLNGTFTINRKDYNIKGNLFGFAVGKEVAVDLRVPAEFGN